MRRKCEGKNALFRLCVLCALMLFALVGGCKHPDDPPPPGPEPGKRDYTWTIDTLSYPASFQTIMFGIWASSPKDVYVVGHSDVGSKGSMYHYDGVRWTEVKLHVSEGGLINALFDLRQIIGFSSNNIWAVGTADYVNPSPPPNFLDSSIILHYDGTGWREVVVPKGGQMLSVGGALSNDFWASGDKGTLYHYDGSSMKKMANIDTSRFLSKIIAFSPGDVYMTSGRSLSGPDTIGDYMYYLNHWNGTRWSVIDSSITGGTGFKFSSSIWGSPSHTLYSSLLGVYRFEGSSLGWKQLLNTAMPVQLALSSDENIFAIGDAWKIYHWNGSDWKEIQAPFKDFGYFTCGWTDNHETFLVGIDGRKTYIMHGK